MKSIRVPLLVILAAALSSAAPAQDSCDNGSFDSTFDLIQKAIFENKGCASDACHGASEAGGLRLTADVAYDNLVSQPATTVDDEDKYPGLMRVVPSQKDQSLLYLNLAAATLPDQWQAPLRPMPLGFEPLSLEELEAVRLWIEAAASRNGVVPGTADLLDACLPPAEPIEVEPLEPPAPGEGVQIKSPRWILEANSENEVCFASYYDVTDQVPERYRGPDGTTFRYKNQQIRQDPLSHHLIVDRYNGAAGPDDPSWGTFRCRGGDKDGELCESTELGFCGPEGMCGSDWKRAIACTGFGPPDQGTVNQSIVIIQEASAQLVFPEGTYREAPLKGMMIWNSHAFNLTDKDGKIEAWMNFDFAEPEEQQFLMQRLFNISGIFSMNVPPFETQQICRHHVFAPGTNIYELSSHTHQRGKRFDIFEGRYVCQDGPNQGAACNPLAGPLELPELCPDSTCASVIPAEFGDCDGDGVVRISDLITSIGIALGQRPKAACPTGDRDGSGTISIAELVALVNVALAPVEMRDPDTDLLYTNLVYNDPTVVLYDPPKALAGTDADRTLTYCSLYDNGYSDPSEVKTFVATDSGPRPCANPTGCIEGRVGSKCSGGSQSARDASCDSTAGAGDGVCGGCTVGGGVTTEDEMYILMGAFYVER